tara:strand:- start:37 stop:297 length:261 start_codon:yes stop_codon:yes gene_type:complete
MARLIKCILVNVDDLLISEIEEIDAEIGEPNCKLTNPVVFESLEKMKPLVEASRSTEFMIRSDDILTIADPTQEVINRYLELTSDE